jgi:2-polyprenyl-3-methyl-5-hydroxy-6-metoxy-1,4-benzoquinol methylase
MNFKNLFHKVDAARRKIGASRNGQKHVSPFSTAQKTMDIILIDACLSGWFKQETAELFEGFKINPDDVVLDAGCGDSPCAYFCALQGAEIIIADIDEKKVSIMVDRLKGSPAKSVTALVSDACQLPVKDASVSKILALEIMEHVDDTGAFLKELNRVGKPGAQYLISAPDPISETVQKDFLPPGHFEKPNHVRVLERQEFERLVTEGGLIIEQHLYYGFYWTIWWLFFWACKQDFCPPWHPLLESWAKTWTRLLETEQGPAIKNILDNFMPKNQLIIARKPAE